MTRASVDFFERIRRVTGDIPWGTFASAMAQNLGESSLAAHEVVEQLKEWGSHLTKNALSKWTVAVMSPTPCDSPDVSGARPKQCPSYAVVKCDVCGRPSCLAHARVDYMGDAICEVCIGEAKARRRSTAWADGGPTPYARPHVSSREAPPPPVYKGMSEAGARRMLRVPMTAGWEQIKRQYRKLVVKHNADRPQSEKTRTANVEKLKKLNEAYAVLREVYERKAAA